ncbi:Nup170p NDAI_0E04120 [Naumovozyma dairenensis CBS 421]|uniref:Nucleoporin Nup133/Nup155-like N-terminal domain-containing protein n=1 Tax=Naumovozyma dairenensis (strain ATCC 10597 / BCRC 20456 / CBS 421 / NBRC 0211 / NRRL Y-12639) TaxID=1071378 RepID=G0WBV9_NAUDC|nr:hypothetical protein NDAI_0E04120 [Naumovozyma dairenensis CBS 421]CCD25229.1 hypothetical protein NDAI_0E04120 [Naumovozyma dairenensis CBS 421]
MFSTPLKVTPNDYNINNNQSFSSGYPIPNNIISSSTTTNADPQFHDRNHHTSVQQSNAPIMALTNMSTDLSNNSNSLTSTNTSTTTTTGAATTTTAATSNNGISNYNLKIQGFGSKKPLELASLYINHLYNQDENTPILDQISYYNNGVSYNFNKEIGGLGAFTPLERTKIINLPDELLQETSKASIKTDMGIFPQLDRTWIIIDNKLILWNHNDPTDYQSIDEIKHTILKVALVKPKPNTFINEINHLLLIATPFDIYILAVSYNGKNSNELSVFNTGMSVSVNGLAVNDIVSYEKTGQIFFSGRSNGLNIWELQYTGSDDWFNSKSNKICLTQSSWANLLPSNVISKIQIPGSELISSFFQNNTTSTTTTNKNANATDSIDGSDNLDINDNNNPHNKRKYTRETVIQLNVDQSRGVIYSLSSNSIIRAYLIKNNNTLSDPVTIHPSYISRIITTTMAKGAAVLGKNYLQIVKIVPVSQQQNNNLFFVAITVTGVRLYFNGSININSIEAICLESIKFPPSSATPEKIRLELEKQQNNDQQKRRTAPFFSSFNYSSESIQLKLQKKSAVLLTTTDASTIVSPGIFVASVIKKSKIPPSSSSPSHQDQTTTPPPTTTTTKAKPHYHYDRKLFVTLPDYGVLKYHGKYIENATFLDTTAHVKQIIPLTPTFNATEKPIGYANQFATQYNSENLQIAVVTDTSIEIYKYRNPDEIFESLIDNPLPFIANYGIIEACSSALYVTCKFNKPALLRSNALTFLTVGIPGIIDIKPKYNRYVSSSFPNTNTNTNTNINTTTTITTKESSMIMKPFTSQDLNLDDVILSPRFYGIALLITRLLRNIWNQKVFITSKPVATTPIKSNTMDNKKSQIDIIGISISKNEIQYYLSSIMILNEFFISYSDSITIFAAPTLSTSSATNTTTTTTTNNNNPNTLSSVSKDKYEEVSNQAENIAINSIIKLTESIKESLSFLNVLYEESELDGIDNRSNSFKDIINFLNVENQSNLIDLNFKHLFAPNDQTKSLIKDILSSIINRNISRGASIEYMATTLQDRCGSFCSAKDILGFRAIEHLRKAKEIGLNKDNDNLHYHLDNAMKLFENIVDDISQEKLDEAVQIMVSLDYFPKTIEFLLNIASLIDRGNLAYQYLDNGSMEYDERKIYYDKRINIYDLVFRVLTTIDERSSIVSTTTTITTPTTSSKKNPIEIETPTNTVITRYSGNTNFNKLREESYNIALRCNDKLFHYHLYDWLVSTDNQDKLLQLDTSFILPYLIEKSTNSLKISNLLWVYQSKKHNFFEAAEILYSLSISKFELKLNERISFLSRANGFCNSVCPPNQKQRMVQLASTIQELFEVAAIQDDILTLVKTDPRLDMQIKSDLINQLDGEILPLTSLFNDYADPLGYYEICLNIFKVSDFRNSEEILSKWNELFESLKLELKKTNDVDYLQDSKTFINLLSSVITKVGKQVHSSELVFPISKLFPIISDLFYKNLPNNQVKEGSIISIFISIPIPYSKLYYILKDLIETTTTTNPNNLLFKKEMTYLIKDWYQSDRKLRDIIPYNEIESLKDYNIDPIENYTTRTGNGI